MRWADERRAALYRELEALEAYEQRVSKFGEDDDYEDGVIIVFKQQWSEGTVTGKIYTYVALKADGKWWLTGRTSIGIPWSRLAEQHLMKATQVDIVTEVEEL